MDGVGLILTCLGNSRYASFMLPVGVRSRAVPLEGSACDEVMVTIEVAAICRICPHEISQSLHGPGFCHRSFSSPEGPMEVFCPIVETSVAQQLATH